jgi:hypothetical protein
VPDVLLARRDERRTQRRRIQRVQRLEDTRQAFRYVNSSVSDPVRIGLVLLDPDPNPEAKKFTSPN